MTKRVFAAVALLLFSAGWAANHFATMLVLLRNQLGVSSVMANGAFGIYALGLLPSLLGGGVLADRFGARPVVLSGSAIAAAGNLSLLFLHEGWPLLAGRFIVGLGVGLTMSAGTAWAGRLRGAAGVTLAGIILTSGFALGPIAAGLLAWALSVESNIAVPFAVSVALSLTAVVYALFAGDTPGAVVRSASRTGPANSTGPARQERPERSMRKALAVSLPMALWVFSSATTAFVMLAARAATHFSNPVLLPGIAATFAFSAALIAQYLGRRFNWGPGSGAAGAGLAALGFLLAAFAGTDVPLWLFVVTSMILGTAYGLCLREGLIGIERFTPPERRGTAIGIYYVFAYLGFGLPVLLDALLPVAGASIPLLVLTGLALGSVLVRGVQIRSGHLA